MYYNANECNENQLKLLCVQLAALITKRTLRHHQMSADSDANSADNVRASHRQPSHEARLDIGLRQAQLGQLDSISILKARKAPPSVEIAVISRIAPIMAPAMPSVVETGNKACHVLGIGCSGRSLRQTLSELAHSRCFFRTGRSCTGF